MRIFPILYLGILGNVVSIPLGFSRVQVVLIYNLIALTIYFVPAFPIKTFFSSCSLNMKTSFRVCFFFLTSPVRWIWKTIMTGCCINLAVLMPSYQSYISKWRGYRAYTTHVMALAPGFRKSVQLQKVFWGLLLLRGHNSVALLKMRD